MVHRQSQRAFDNLDVEDPEMMSSVAPMHSAVCEDVKHSSAKTDAGAAAWRGNGGPCAYWSFFQICDNAGVQECALAKTEKALARILEERHGVTATHEGFLPRKRHG